MTKIVDYYSNEIKHFVDAMKYKLHVHRAKGKWEGKSLDELFDLLVKEVEELREAVKDGNQIAIILESADCSNYAMIIANVAMKIASGINTNDVLDLIPRSIEDINKTHASHITTDISKIQEAIIA